MTVTGWVCNSCACLGIQSLGSETDAKSAMLAFCKTQLVAAATLYGKPDSLYVTPNSFYVFVAGPEVPGYSHSKKWLKYGTEFATFIETNGLGPVVSPGQTINMKHHPSEKTTCQTWVWMPDKAALIKWWEANNVEKPVEPLPKVEFKGQIEFKAIPQTYKKKLRGVWDRAFGVADGNYRCKHCDKTFVKNERIWNSSKGGFFCEVYGREQEKDDEEEEKV